MSDSQGIPATDPSSVPPLEVVRLGHPVLRSVAESVPDEWFGTGRLANLFYRLLGDHFKPSDRLRSHPRRLHSNLRARHYTILSH